MKKLLLCSLLLVFISGFNMQAQDQAAQMQQWQEYMTPGPMHKVLAWGVGQWKSEYSFHMDPSQPPIKAEGTAVCESIFDGRYFQTKYNANLMGMPYSGVELMGYDNAKKKFFSSWIDNMGTGIMNLEGTMDESTHTITLTGSASDFNGMEVKAREVLKAVDDDTYLFELWMDRGKGENISIEGKYTRIKS